MFKQTNPFDAQYSNITGRNREPNPLGEKWWMDFTGLPEMVEFPASS